MPIRDIHPTPRELPSARLFLDDIEQLISIVANPLDPDSTVNAAAVFRVGHRECDNISELPRIGPGAQSLEIRCGRVTLYLGGECNLWSWIGGTEEQQWRFSQRLGEFLRRRAVPWWRTVRGIGPLVVGSCWLILLIPSLIFRQPAKNILLLTLAAVLFSPLPLVVPPSTRILFRHRFDAERPPRRIVDLWPQVLLLLIGTIIGVAAEWLRRRLFH